MTDKLSQEDFDDLDSFLDEEFGDFDAEEDIDETEEFDMSDDLDSDFGNSDSSEPSLDDFDSDEEEFEVVEEEDNLADYADGAIIEDDRPAEKYIDDDGIISETGDIVVMDRDDGDSFELKYIDINNIAIVKRIRQGNNVESLVRSIKSTGLIEPIVVAPTATQDVYVLIAGYRRILACARCGKRMIPCIVNTKISTPDIPILEALYNHCKSYTIAEIVDYIDYLEKQKGIMSASMIEYLLQLNSGDYTKLKDILNDNDEDIVEKLYSGVYTIEMAFKKLEQRRKKESAEEKESKQAEKAYANEEESGMDNLEGSGEEVDEGEELSPEEIQNLMIDPTNIDADIEDKSLGEMIKDNENMPGFEPHKQKVGEREYIDPEIKKATMARDKTTCQCCKRGGQEYADILDFHHILPVFLGGNDSLDNGVMLCVACHRLVHLYSTGDLYIDSSLIDKTWDELSEDQKLKYENEQIFEDEKKRFKRVVRFGGIIRQGISQRGMKREQYKKEHPNTGIGRNLPGKGPGKQTRA